MGELMQNPKKAEHGKFLQATSVEGQKVDFVSESNYATATLTLAASGDASNNDFGTFSATFNYIVDDNQWPWESIVAWQYVDFYVDGSGIGLGFDTNLYRRGSAVAGTSAATRKTMNIDIFHHPLYVPILTEFADDGHANIWYCKNNDSSSHVIGLASVWKYIVTGGINGEV